ncbi:MAG TPA: BatA domain-containing protein [Gemmatimonadales bacterium]|nr:BatA domain-containing protein [Gemmatimonadales bacterium]
MIGFLYPWALVGLLAAGIPILLHLLQRREPPTVVFPAGRYLIAATQQHQRRLKIQNWLLLVVRALLVVALVLAAAGPMTAARGVAGHAPSALVLVLDDSPSSGVVVNGTPRLAQLTRAARAVLDRATADDAVWLLTSDGVPRRGDPLTLRGALDRLEPSARRMDLGAALAAADEVLAAQARPGEIVLITDLQASALSPASPRAPLTVARPDDAPGRNSGIGALAAGTQPWSSEGGRVVVSLTGDSGAPVPVSVRLGERPPRQALAPAGGSVTIPVPGATAGWWPLTADLNPDELRADDRRVSVVRIAPPARVAWDPADRYIAAAADVLVANRRIARGSEITLGRLGPGPSVVPPPADPAELGPLNRALERRGVAWRFGALASGAGRSDSLGGQAGARVLRRYALEPTASGATGVLARVDGAPWIVRSGNVVLLGSRLDPAWTDLPLSAGFMPFMDYLINRAARGEVALVDAPAGDPALLPDRVTEVRHDRRSWAVEGGAPFRAPEPGVYFLLAGRDTVGALAANIDTRESRLARASDAQVRELWRGARIVPLERAGAAAFASAARGDLRGPLLWAGLVLGLVEVGLASAWRRER